MNWIDINVEQPKPMDHVLVYCEGGYIQRDIYWGKDHGPSMVRYHSKKEQGQYGRWFGLVDRGYKVTHWMHLPQPPTESEAEE